MTFEDILAACIDAIEQGISVESCLATYPEVAAELEPLLRIVSRVRRSESPRLAADAFARGRGRLAVAAAARHAERVPAVSPTDEFPAPATADLPPAPAPRRRVAARPDLAGR